MAAGAWTNPPARATEDRAYPPNEFLPSTRDAAYMLSGERFFPCSRTWERSSSGSGISPLSAR